MSKSEVVFSQKKLPVSSFQTFANMRLNGDLCDVTLIVKSTKISAHRLVLAANVPYFHDIFVNNIAKRSTSEVILPTVEPSTVQSLINFVYNYELKINSDNVKSLLMGASLFEMDEILDACYEFITKGMDLGNVLDIREFAIEHNFIALKIVSDEFVQKHFIKIAQSNSFLELPFSDVKELLRKDEIHVINEETVYQAAMAWVKWSLKDREDSLLELLTTVRMPFLSYQFLSGHVTSEALIQKSPSCLKLLKEAKDHCIESDHVLPCSCNIKPRNFSSYGDSCNAGYIYAVCSLLTGLSPTVVERYDLATAKWQTMGAQTEYVTCAAVVAMGKNLYVIGGLDSMGRLLDSVLVYDSELDVWSKIASLRKEKRFVSAVVCSNRIFVCGGEVDDDVALCEVECYCPDGVEWTNLPEMLECRSGACSVSLNKNIYVLGGCNHLHGGEIKLLSSIEMYSPDIQQWTLVSHTSSAFYCRGATSLNGKIYVHGEKLIEVYEPLKGEWKQITHVKKNRSGFTLLTFNGKLYVVNSQTIDIFDPETNEWSEGEPFAMKLHFIGAGKVSVY